MREFFKERIAAFKYAFAGLGYLLRNEPNAWIHLVISIAVTGVGFWLDLSRQEWLFIIIAAGFVWITELLNTTTEVLVDLVSPEVHPLAKIIKDVCAGAVLLAAITAALIGLLVLGPPLLAKLGILLP